jgi:PAS domain S-box-containing protein
MKNKISDLIDFERVNELLEGFSRSTGFVTAILDLEGNVLSRSGWRNICTDFHRIHPETAKKCRISDTKLANKMAEGEKYHFYPCLNGLVDVAVPIVINGEHIANLFSGQFFFEEPDLLFFKKQAETYEFDEIKYMGALKKVPVVSKEKVEATMDFLQNMTQFISETAFQKLEQTELNKALRESEFQYRNLANTGLALIWTSGTDKLCNYFNDPWLTFTGRTLSQEMGHGWTEGVHPDDFDRCLETYVTAFDKHEPFEMEYRLRHASGEYRIILDLGTPNFNSNGEFMGYIGHCFDITERKRTEESLWESEEKYRVLFNTFPLGITISDPTGKIVESNARAAELLGIPKDEQEMLRINGNQWRIIRPDGTPMPTEEYASTRALKENRLVENVEMVIKKPDGTITWINVTAAPLLLENFGVVITYNDITAHRKAEQDYQTLFREMLDGFALHEIVCDASGKPVDYRFLTFNPAFERMTGLTAQDTLGKTVLEVMPGTEQHWIETYGNVALTGEPAFFENYTAEIEKHFEVTAFRPAPNQFACIISDITVRKLDESEKEKLQAQLNQAQKMESVGRLAGGVAHDFNNMLGVILGHTEMALDDVDPAQPLFDDLLEIRKAAERSADLTRQLLTFARKQTVSPKVIDLNETVEGMLKMLRRLIGEDIDLLWKPGRNLRPVKVDPSQIDQLLANLCVNARDAITGVGKITIETGVASIDEAYCADHPGFSPGEFLLLAVSDNGCGMGPDTLSHLFEPFFTTKEMGKGTGLGLASVYGMVKQNNGFINVYSEPGQGTTFRIYLPLFTAESALLTKKEQSRQAERGHETIMLVEDEPSILKMATMMLEKLGYTVLATSNPGEAIRLANEHSGQIDMLMTDVVMPGMNGRDLASNLLTFYPDLKRLFMSGYTANVIAHHGVLDEGVHFIQKPFSRKDLAAKVRQVLGQAQE